MDKLLNFLGLCRRAGKLITGNDMVIDAVRGGGAELVLTASDISPNTEKKIKKTCGEYGVELIKIDRDKDEISQAIGRFAAVAAITDTGFARNVAKLAEATE